jgi:multidrug efflux pump
MPSFFIDRPIFAWVVALFICLIGAISIPLLAIAQYPIIAPPSISISTSYPGASPENLYNSVTRLIEEELNGASGILNFESASDSLGQVEIIANFEPGTDPSMASVEVQNRIKRVEARLPRAVIQQGILVEEASKRGAADHHAELDRRQLDEVGLGDFMVRNVLGEIRRIPGVGRATLYSTERSLRIWIDPAKLVGYGLTADDVTRAITAQNAQVASGSIGAEPSTAHPEDLRACWSRASSPRPTSSAPSCCAPIPTARPCGCATSRASRSAAWAIQFNTRLNGKPTAGLSVLLSPTGNALATASAVEAKMKELSRFFPANISYEIPYNITPVVKASIEKVLMTLVEAVVLVFIVMFLFLQNIRYTIIPTIVVPVALLGTCATLLAVGYSINMLTMFGMVLAIGILVDDAIVVVENVERIMAEEGLSPKEATRKAMTQITSAIIGITLVLIAVFVPMAFFPGSVGIIYRQFSVTMVAAIGFSALLALSLTPALCATLLKPVEKGHGHAKARPVRLVQPRLDTVPRPAIRHRRLVAEAHRPADGDLSRAVRRASAGRSCGCPAASCRSTTRASSRPTCRRRPMPPTTAPKAAVEQVEKYLKTEKPGVENVTFLTGFSFLGQGMNTAQAFITLKDWSERGPNDSAAAIVADINRDMASIRDAEDLGPAAAADRQSRQLLGLQLPPAGSWPEGLCGADPPPPSS